MTRRFLSSLLVGVMLAGCVGASAGASVSSATVPPTPTAPASATPSAMPVPLPKVEGIGPGAAVAGVQPLPPAMTPAGLPTMPPPPTVTPSVTPPPTATATDTPWPTPTPEATQLPALPAQATEALPVVVAGPARTATVPYPTLTATFPPDVACAEALSAPLCEVWGAFLTGGLTEAAATAGALGIGIDGAYRVHVQAVTHDVFPDDVTHEGCHPGQLPAECAAEVVITDAAWGNGVFVGALADGDRAIAEGWIALTNQWGGFNHWAGHPLWILIEGLP